MADATAFRKRSLPPPPSPDEQVELGRGPTGKTDGRSLRRTGRTELVATRFTREYKQLLFDLAAAHEIKLVEVIEQALDLYADRHPPRRVRTA